jgi:microcystin-dependent protein
MGSIYSWSTDAAANATADDGLTWAEGQAPSTVNNSARVMMQRVAELLKDLSGSLVTTNTGNAYALASESDVASYIDGLRVMFRASAANTGSPTLSLNLIGSKSIVKMTGAGEAPILPGEIQSGAIYEVVYSSALSSGAGAWLLLNPSVVSTPVGVILPYAGADAPTGFLLCYGQAVSRTTYADLFAAIGSTYGAGDGSTTFGLPDLRGRVVIGRDDMGGTAANRVTDAGSGLDGTDLGAVGGVEKHTLTKAQLPNFSPTFSGNALPGIVNVGVSSGNLSTPTGPTIFPGFTPTTIQPGTPSGTISAIGSGEAHPNVQPSIVLNSIIKFR